MAKFLTPEEMTSQDYYFDSYAHFGIHEVTAARRLSGSGGSEEMLLSTEIEI